MCVHVRTYVPFHQTALSSRWSESSVGRWTPLASSLPCSADGLCDPHSPAPSPAPDGRVGGGEGRGEEGRGVGEGGRGERREERR